MKWKDVTTENSTFIINIFLFYPVDKNEKKNGVKLSTFFHIFWFE